MIEEINSMLDVPTGSIDPDSIPMELPAGLVTSTEKFLYASLLVGKCRSELEFWRSELKARNHSARSSTVTHGHGADTAPGVGPANTGVSPSSTGAGPSGVPGGNQSHSRSAGSSSRASTAARRSRARAIVRNLLPRGQELSRRVSHLLRIAFMFLIVTPNWKIMTMFCLYSLLVLIRWPMDPLNLDFRPQPGAPSTAVRQALPVVLARLNVRRTIEGETDQERFDAETRTALGLRDDENRRPRYWARLLYQTLGMFVLTAIPGASVNPNYVF